MKRLICAGVVLATSFCLTAWQGHVVRAADLPCSTSAGHVTLVVEHGDGTSLQRCVGINGTSAIAETVLTNSGVQYYAPSTAAGVELCQVDNEPATGSFPVPCLQNGTQYYWGIFLWNHTSWQYASHGISALQLNSGDALGLRFESVSGQSAPPAPTVVCPAPTSSTSALSPRNLASSAGRTSSYGTSTNMHAAGGGAPQAAGTTSGSDTQATAAAGAVLALHTTAATHSPPPAGGISWTILFACLACGGLLGLVSVQLARR